MKNFSAIILFLFLIILFGGVVQAQDNKNSRIIDFNIYYQSGDSTITTKDLPFPYPPEFDVIMLTENMVGDEIWLEMEEAPGDMLFNNEIHRLDKQFLLKIESDTMHIHGKILQSTRLVKDINHSGEEGSYPTNFMPLKDKLLFSARINDNSYYYEYSNDSVIRRQGVKLPTGDHLYMEEFYKCNDEEYVVSIDGVKLLNRKLYRYSNKGNVDLVAEFKYGKKIYKGDKKWDAQFNLCEFNNQIYFQGYDKKHGHELWSFSDEEEPHLVKDLFKGKKGSYPWGLVAVNKKLFFKVKEKNGGNLFMCNENEEIVKLDKENGYAYDFHVTKMISFQNTLIFAAIDSLKRQSIWVFDGKEKPELLSSRFTDFEGVKFCGSDFLFEDVSFCGDNFLVWNDVLYFAGEDKSHGSELWAFDGINEPYIVANIFERDVSGIDELTVYKDKLYFTADEAVFDNGDRKRVFDVLWVYDGISAPHMVKSGDSLITSINELTVYGDTLFFLGDDGILGRELWCYEENNGFKLVANIDKKNYGNSSPDLQFTLNNDLFFVAEENIHGRELWKMNDKDSVSFVYDIYPGRKNPEINNLTVYNNKAYFTAEDSLHGFGLWEFDGINSPRFLFGFGEGVIAYDVNNFVVFQGALYYRINNNEHEIQVCRYNFKDAPVVVRAFNNLQPSNLFVFKDKVLFVGYTQVSGLGLWEYNGSTSQMISKVEDNLYSFTTPDGFMECNGKVYFSSADRETGIELWVYDGENAPHMVTDILPGVADSKPVPRVVFQNKLFFTAMDKGGRQQLWQYDGQESPSLVSDLKYRGTINPSPESFVVFEDKLFFACNMSGEFYKKVLWVYDGKSEPHPLITNLTDNTITYDNVRDLFVHNNRLYFAGNDDNCGVELWEYKTKF